jgi:hypothetical protein
MVFVVVSPINLEKKSFLLTPAELGVHVLWNNQIIMYCGTILECMYQNLTLSSALALFSSVLSPKKLYNANVGKIFRHQTGPVTSVRDVEHFRAIFSLCRIT